ncbi:MAG: DUF3592 domain-containing protein [Pirellulaceae bacterium]
MVKVSESDIPLGCWVAFCVPFICVGLFATGLIYWTLWTTHQTNQWIEVPCTVEFAKLERHSSGDSVTYSVRTRYQYEFKGQAYTSSQVRLNLMIVNSERQWQRELVDTLKQHAKSREPYRCFVDPTAPSQSVLVRDIRFFPLFVFSIFSIAFGLGGAAFASALSSRPAAGKRIEIAKASRKPWLVRKDWERGRITWSAWRNSTSKWFVLLYLLVATLPIATIVPHELRNGNHWAWLGLLAPSWAMLWACSIVAGRGRRWRAGRPHVQLATIPGVLGGELAGSFNCRRTSSIQREMRLRLACHQTSSHRRNRSSMALTESVWNDERIVSPDHHHSSDNATDVYPFRFTIPYGLPASNANPSDRVDWVLMVSPVARPRGDAIEFMLPVFETEDSSPEVGGKARNRSTDDADPSIDMLAETGVHARQFGNRQTFRIAGQKSFATLAALFYFSIVFGLTALSLAKTDVSWFLVCLFAGIAALIFWGWAHTILWRCRIEVESGSIAIQSGAIHWPTRKWYPVEEFAQLLIRLTTQMNDKGYYQVYFKTQDGRQFVVGKGIFGRRLAKLYAQQLWRRVIGDEPPTVETLSFRD